MPDCWQKLPEAKQQDIIDRLERQVRNAATIAVHTIAGGEIDAGQLGGQQQQAAA
ncbi:hypothetical protein [Pseudomonas aeruginosa]|nr:hypothetical protein [Pseudomonas aeruginosa]MDI2468433.1 hypothetical protein [Pseudomonas aeruginosa]MDI2583717.1 hypothetical protein [Pseudomonas aeruginosa]